MSPQPTPLAADGLRAPASHLLGAPIQATQGAATPPAPAPATAARRHAGRWPATTLTAPRERFALSVVCVQAVLVCGVVALGPPDLLPALTAASTAAAVVLACTRLGGHRPAGWFVVLAGWQRRRWAARSAVRHGERINPLWLVSRPPQVATVTGPKDSEIGLLRERTGWNGVLWVTDSSAPDDDSVDGLTEMLALPAPRSPAVRMRAVVQQSSPEATDADAALMVTAWLVLQVEPVPALEPRTAVGAVPALLRSEIRHLIRHTSDGGIRLVTLDRSDLLSALSTSAEIPPDAAAGPAAVSESWRGWQACGRHHHAFAVRPHPATDVAATVDLLLEAATLAPGTTVTVSVRYGPRPGWLGRYPVTVRVSHASASVVTQIVDRVHQALRASGCRSRGLGGLQGPAVLDTSVMAGQIPG